MFNEKYKKMYPEELTRPMVEELTSVGFKELKSSDDVDTELNEKSGHCLVLDPVLNTR